VRNAENQEALERLLVAALVRLLVAARTDQRESAVH
jgi:hypothetical protein